MATTRTFTRTELDGFGLPYEGYDGVTIVSDEITSKNRWSLVRTLIFRLDGQPEGEAWKVRYFQAATEYQEQDVWDHAQEIEATLVHEWEKLVKVWVDA